MELKLDNRKKVILKAIIQTYLETGEPVGSRTISKYTDLNLSSATIRNEMADLEEMGLIVQPHTSAGRIPTDQGYRIYVDEMMEEQDRALKEKDKEVADVKDFFIQKFDQVETLLQQMAKLLAQNTNYAAMIAGPQLNQNKLKYLQLSKVEDHKILTVIVVEGNIIKNTLLEVEQDTTDTDILKLNLLMNTALCGLSIQEINLGIINKLKEDAGTFAPIVESVLVAVGDAIGTGEGSQTVYTSGATNIFKYPELSDSSKASEILQALEDKTNLATTIAHTSQEATENGDHGIQVYIGSESPIENMKDCSLVTANYELSEGIHGTIGIIGPKRMDYDKVVSTLKQLMDQLDEVYHKDE